MTIILFSDKNYEAQAIECIKSFQSKIVDDVKVIYYTINFKSDVKLNNVTPHEYITNKNYYKLNFYKPDLCLLTTQLYADTHYIYIDIDFILSKKVNFDQLKHDEEYPLASYGPVEYPCIYEYVGGLVYTESLLMKYFNVPQRTMRYVWNCFFVFNNKCIDFLEEWKSMCENEYLLKQKEKIFPSQDETPFNVCLWKRNATKNLGHAFLNTISVSKVKFIEENFVRDFSFGECLDCNNFDWETVHDSDHILGYHAFKNIDDMKECSTYMNSDQKNKNCVVIDCYIDNNEKLDILKNNIYILKKLKLDVILVSHSILPKSIIELVEFYIYDRDNTYNDISFHTIYTHLTTNYDVILSTYPDDNIKSHEYCIISSLRNAMYLAESLGYDKCVFTEFDNLYTDQDLNKILSLLYKLYKYPNKKAVFLEDGSFCETIFFISNPSFLLMLLDSYFPRSLQEYNSKFSTVVPYGLELFFSRMIERFKSDIEIVNNRFHNFFSTPSHLNLSRVNSVGAYIVVNNNDFYLCVKSLDKIVYNLDVYENDVFIKNSMIFSDIIPLLKIEDVTVCKKFKVLFHIHDSPTKVSHILEITFDPNKTKYYSSRGILTFK